MMFREFQKTGGNQQYPDCSKEAYAFTDSGDISGRIPSTLSNSTSSTASPFV
jgi:hypothetical protein